MQETNSSSLGFRRSANTDLYSFKNEKYDRSNWKAGAVIFTSFLQKVQDVIIVYGI